MTNQNNWWQLHCQAENSEEFASLAMIEGANGTEIIDAEEFYAYTDTEPSELIERLKGYGITVKESQKIQSINYVQKCAEVWQPITVGEINLKPVLDSDGPIPNSEINTVWMIPGNGFGTGHHESTRLAIGLMLHDEVKKLNPRIILDLGTGNGVLGLAAATKFECIIDAIDTDPLAIENAEQNCRLNKSVGEKLNLIVGDINRAKSSYDLIFANIYASTLMQLQEEIKARLRSGGCAILAGIMVSESDDIKASFDQGWEVIKSSSEGNWISFLLRKN